MTTAQTESNAITDRYFDLVRFFPLRPIRSDAELDRAIAVVNSLIDRNDLATDEEDYLDVLADLIHKFENETHPLPNVSEAEMLRYLIEARDITQLKLATDTGIAESTISQILSGKRALSRNHIATLSGYFKVSPAVFIS
jgi:HTH-type transcriptional regulator / antitoxin HigA